MFRLESSKDEANQLTSTDASAESKSLRADDALLEFEATNGFGKKFDNPILNDTSTLDDLDAKLDLQRDLEPADRPSLSSLDERIRRTPIKKVIWEDEKRGESFCRPAQNDKQTKKLLAQYGREGVEYHAGEPDFTPFCRYKSKELGEFVGQVKIENMNERQNRRREGGLEKVLGNYAQADERLAARLSLELGREITRGQIEDYRKQNNLSWHECLDMTTMQLVPCRIHNVFSHRGGTAEARQLRKMMAENSRKPTEYDDLPSLIDRLNQKQKSMTT